MKKRISVLLALMMLLTTISVFSVHAAEVERNIENVGTPICDVLTPGGGGSKFIRVIKDGVIPTAAEQATMQYDTYVKGDVQEHESYFGYTFEEEFKVTSVVFHEGLHYESGGWFADGNIRVQALVGETWQDVTLTNTPGYPVGNTAEVFGKPFEAYTFEFSPVTCTGIRVIGSAGGTKYYTSCSELTVKAMVDEDKELIDPALKEKLAAAAVRYEENGYLEGFATPITNAAPGGTSGGSQDVGVINDGVTVEKDNTNSRLQFDSYNSATKINTVEYIGYTFAAPYEIEKMIYQTGYMWDNGGWFGYGFEVEVLIHGKWKKLDVDVTPEYPESNSKSDFVSYETYEINFEKIVCEGVRMTGLAGGTKNFISCTELTVKGNMTPDLTAYAGADDGENNNNQNSGNNSGNNNNNTQKPADKNDNNNNNTQNGTPNETAGAETEAPKKSGCGSSVSMELVCLAALGAVSVAGVVMRKRGKETENH